MGVQPISVPPSLAYVLNTAGERSGVDFDYLLQTAIRESSLNPKAKAQTSSATGLFQFIESTWLEVMKSDGPRLGYQQYADAITLDADGDYVIKDKALRQDVLKLREDPQVAADLAAAFTRNNGAYIHQRFGRMPSPGELYIAHFLGARGPKMFVAGLADPDQVAAKLFPGRRRRTLRSSTTATARGPSASLPGARRQHGASGPAVDAKFAAQQLTSAASGLPQSKWPDAQPVPSRFTPDDMSFTQLFSTEGEIRPRTLLSPERPESDAALFTRLYAP